MISEINLSVTVILQRSDKIIISEDMIDNHCYQGFQNILADDAGNQ